MSLNNQVFAVLNTFAATVNGATRILRESLMSLGIDSVEEAEPIVTAWAGQRHGVALVEGQRKAKGRMVLDSTAAAYEAAKTSRRRVMEALTGDADKDASPKAEGAADEVEIPEELLAAAAKLAKLAQQYEGARKLAAKALAQAFAK